MDEDRFNRALRGFLKEVGVSSQREIEKLVREHPPQAGILRLRMALTSPDAPALNHVSSTIFRSSEYRDFTDLSLQPTPDGWTGRQPHRAAASATTISLFLGRRCSAVDQHDAPHRPGRCRSAAPPCPAVRRSRRAAFGEDVADQHRGAASACA